MSDNKEKPGPKDEKQPDDTKFGWSKEDVEGLKFEKASEGAGDERSEVQAEIDKVDALLKAAGLTEAEIDALAEEDYDEDE